MLVGLVERLAVPGRPLAAPFSDKLVGWKASLATLEQASARPSQCTNLNFFGVGP